MNTTRTLGNTDLDVAPVSLGGNVFGWTINEKQSFTILDAFVDGGFNLIDTADVYSRWGHGNQGGESETIMGNWLEKRRNRNKVIITTKVGSDMGNGKKGLSKKYIIQAAEDSLTRLQTSYIDLYLTHFDEEQTSVEEVLEAYKLLVSSGKVRWIGTSNMSPTRILESVEASKKNSYPVYQVLEPEYNLYQRKKFENDYEQLCIDNNLGVVPYFALASGFLSGKYRDKNDFKKSIRGGSMAKYMNPRGIAILNALDTVCERCNVSPATIAIAWLIARPSVTAPIASATNVSQLQEIMKAATLVLSPDDINLLDKASEEK